MTEREVLKLMIEAFEAIPEEIEGWIPDKCTDAVIAAKEVLAQPKPASIGKSISNEEAYWRDEMLSGD